MKTMTSMKRFLFLPILALLITSCNNNDEPMIDKPKTIVDLASETSTLSDLVAALKAADGDLVNVLSGSGPFTVLAPTNTAFETFLTANGFSDLSEVPTDVLAQILLNHVIDGNVSASDLEALGSGYTKTFADGAANQKMDLFFDTSNGVVFNGVAKVSSPDIEASNGTIHIVDAVIGLPTIVTHAAANPALSSLVGALTSGGNTTFTDLLSTAGNFTVFAPDNAAFAAFTNPSDNDLNQILSNHVISGVAALSSDLTNSYVKTLATFGNTDSHLDLYINTDDGVTLNGKAKVTRADIIASNGVIHVVDEVIDLPTIVDFAVSNPTFENLVAALTRSDLTFDFVSALSTPNGTSPAPFTVFAPTNDAFAGLLTELGISSLNDIDEPTLKATLNYHAVAGANVLAANLSDGMTVSTLGGNITANVTGGATLTDANGRVSNIILTDVQASNGVIHAIDKVILPPLN